MPIITVRDKEGNEWQVDQAAFESGNVSFSEPAPPTPEMQALREEEAARQASARQVAEYERSLPAPPVATIVDSSGRTVSVPSYLLAEEPGFASVPTETGPTMPTATPSVDAVAGVLRSRDTSAVVSGAKAVTEATKLLPPPPGFTYGIDPITKQLEFVDLTPFDKTKPLAGWRWLPKDPNKPEKAGHWTFIPTPDVLDKPFEGIPSAVVGWLQYSLSQGGNLDVVPEGPAREWVRFIFNQARGQAGQPPGEVPFGLGIPPAGQETNIPAPPVVPEPPVMPIPPGGEGEEDEDRKKQTPIINADIWALLAQKYPQLIADQDFVVLLQQLFS